MRRLSFIVLLGLMANCLSGVEYYVEKNGNDEHDGMSLKTAFSTVARGVEALAPGDVLTIGPGEYREAVARDHLGKIGVTTVIRARIPQTVLLRGDVPAPTFRKKESARFIFEADCDLNVQAVNERDTAKIYSSSPSLNELRFKPGCFHYDAAKGKLFVTTSDFRSPDDHLLTVSVIRDSGLRLNAPKQVIVEGLAFSGYNCSTPGGRPGANAKWGILLSQGEKCQIRNCVAFLNGGGIGVSGNGNLVEGCECYGNFSPFCETGGNILYWGSVENGVIRDCVSHSTEGACVRFYEGVIKNCLIEEIRAWGGGNSDVWIKGRVEDSWVRSSVILGDLQSKKVSDSLFRFDGYNHDPSSDNIALVKEKNLRLSDEFADPDNMDFHLQADSRFRKSGPDGTDRGPFPYEPNIFYVSPEGDDTADGLSIKSAWKTLSKAMSKLKSDDTLYIAPGTYVEGGELSLSEPGVSDVRVLGRGVAPVLIHGSFRFGEIKGLRMERLSFVGSSAPLEISNCEDVVIDNCVFNASVPSTALTTTDTTNLRVTHCVFARPDADAMALSKCGNVFLKENIFNNERASALNIDDASRARYSDYNAYANGTSCWIVGGKSWDYSELRKRFDAHSKLVEPLFSFSKDGLPVLLNANKFAGAGQFAKPIGAYRRTRDERMTLMGPFLHRVGRSSVDIEWWTSRPSTTLLRWGETKECLNEKNTCCNVKRSSYRGTCYHTMSVNNLTPGRTYFFKVESQTPKFEYHIDPALKSEDEARPRTMVTSTVHSFTTKRGDATTPEQYYVSMSGNDDDTGLTPEQAWRTISHAAAVVGPGDVVSIDAGRYGETIRPLATGEPNAPITFQAMPGKTVVVEGFDKRLAHAFDVQNKDHIRIRGFHFKDFGNILGDAGTILVTGCRDILVERCFNDGRSPGYSPQFILGKECEKLTIKNCVIVRCFLAGLFFYCPNLRVENNVFYGDQITALTIVEGPKDKARVENNVFFDNIPTKLYNPIISLRHLQNLVLKNNCFYLRIPENEREVVRIAKEEMSVEAFSKRAGTDTDSIFLNPDIPAIEKIITYDSKKNWLEHRGLKDFVRVNKVELFQNPDKTFKKLDFEDFFSKNDVLRKRGVGLVENEFAGNEHGDAAVETSPLEGKK